MRDLRGEANEALTGALRDLRQADPAVSQDGLDQLAALAARGFQPALRPLLQAVMQQRLAENTVRRVLLDPADVDDAVQATLIVVAEKISSFRSDAPFAGWLGRVARNEALLVLRRRRRKSEPVSYRLPETDHRARRLSSLLADEIAVQSALGRLSSEHQQVLRLREHDDLSYKEIADQLGLPVGTVRSRINRARRALAELLLS